MLILETIKTLKTQRALKRSPCGRPLTNRAVECIEATLQDEKNYQSQAILCKNCCIILSSLLVPSGCPHCGSKDMSVDITEANILK